VDKLLDRLTVQVVTTDNSKFSAMLAYFRNRAKLSQAELGRQCDLDNSYISRLEAGSRMPTREAVDRIGDILGLKTKERSQFVAAAGFMPVGGTILEHPVLVDIDTLLSHPRLDPKVKKIALDQLNSIQWWLRLGAGIEDKVSSKEIGGD